MLECNIARHRSVAVFCMLYMNMCNPMQPLYGTLPMPYVSYCGLHIGLWLHIGILNYAPPRCRTSQYRRTFIPLSVSLWNDLGDHVFDGVGLMGFKSRANAF